MTDTDSRECDVCLSIPRVSGENLPRASLKAEFYQSTQFSVKGMFQMNSTKPTDASRVRAKFPEFLNHRHPQKESL